MTNDSSILDKVFDLGSDEEISVEELDELFSEAMQDFREGEVVTGTIVDITEDRVMVDIGYKSEGIITASEFPDPESLQVGQTFDVYIEAPEDEAGEAQWQHLARRKPRTPFRRPTRYRCTSTTSPAYWCGSLWSLHVADTTSKAWW